MLWFAWLKFRLREPPWLRMPPPPPIPPAARAVLVFTWLKLINAPAPMAVVAILSVFIVPPPLSSCGCPQGTVEHKGSSRTSAKLRMRSCRTGGSAVLIRKTFRWLGPNSPGYHAGERIADSVWQRLAPLGVLVEGDTAVDGPGDHIRAWRTRPLPLRKQRPLPCGRW